LHLLSAAHQLAWTHHPEIWLCESCAILWLVLRAVRSASVRTGVLLMLCGLLLNALVTQANAGAMPVVGMPSSVHPASSMWRAASSTTRLPFLADQAQLGLFSIGDIALLLGGILIVAICLQRALRVEGSPNWNRRQLTIAVGTIIADRPPHRPGRALISASGSYLG
jgi:Family of unknown function (DUF5317)